MANYILDANDEPVLEPDFWKYATWFESADRHVAKTELPNGVTVSTVFLGIDHGWRSGIPVLWETMIFGGEHADYQERYSSRADALAGHAKAVEIATGRKAP